MSDDPRDYLILGTTRSPGRLRLRGHDRQRDWDVQKAKGQTGASSALNGEPIGEFEAIWDLVVGDGGDVDELPDWESFQRVLESLTSGPEPTALPVYHPDLARNRYTEVSVAMIGGLVHDGKGGAQVVVKFIEYRPPKPKPAAGATPRGSGQGAGEAPGAQRPDPNAAAKRELDALLTKARET